MNGDYPAAPIGYYEDKRDLENRIAALEHAILLLLSDYEAYDFNPKTKAYDIPLHDPEIVNTIKALLGDV